MPRPGIYIEDEENQFTATDWKELSAVMKPGGADTFTIDSSEATLVGQIPSNKKRAAFAFFRGYSYADTTSPWKLHRLNPVMHPSYPWLYCHSVAFQDLAPTKNPDLTSGYPKRIAADFNSLIDTTYYLQTKVTLGFKPFAHNFFADDSSSWSGKELDRNVVRYADTQVNLELLTIGDRPIKYVESVGGGPPIGQPFPGQLHERKTVVEFVLKWLNVEESFILNDAGKPVKLMARVGRVNSDTFLGFAPETLLMAAPKFTRYQQPVWTDNGQGLYAYDIEIPLSYFDPEPAVGRGSSLNAGWNLFPYSKAGEVTGGSQWLSARRSENNTPYLELINYAAMFTHVLS